MTVHNETILIIEEDNDLRRLLSLALRLGGFSIREARDGLEAMAILEQLVPIDAVVLDVILPDIDGLSIRQEIAAHAGNIPVIVITDSQEPLQDLHPSCVVRKPVVPDDIVTAVVKCLRDSASAAADAKAEPATPKRKARKQEPASPKRKARKRKPVSP